MLAKILPRQIQDRLTNRLDQEVKITKGSKTKVETHKIIHQVIIGRIEASPEKGRNLKSLFTYSVSYPCDS